MSVWVSAREKEKETKRSLQLLNEVFVISRQPQSKGLSKSLSIETRRQLTIDGLSKIFVFSSENCDSVSGVLSNCLPFNARIQIGLSIVYVNAMD